MLTPCTGCARHVRASEQSCPFCSLERRNVVAVERALPPMPKDPLLTRAALAFVGVTALAACGKTTAKQNEQPPPASSDLKIPAYGAPPIDPATLASMMGVVDAGPIPDAGPVTDGSRKDGGK